MIGYIARFKTKVEENRNKTRICFQCNVSFSGKRKDKIIWKLRNEWYDFRDNPELHTEPEIDQFIENLFEKALRIFTREMVILGNRRGC